MSIPGEPMGLERMSDVHLCYVSEIAKRDAEIAALRARLAAAEAREARLVGALTALLERWRQFTDEHGGWGNQQDAYYDLAKHAQPQWHEAKAALTTDGSALAQAIEGAVSTFTAMGEHDDPNALYEALDTLRRAWGQR